MASIQSVEMTSHQVHAGDLDALHRRGQPASGPYGLLHSHARPLGQRHPRSAICHLVKITPVMKRSDVILEQQNDIILQRRNDVVLEGRNDVV